MEESSLSEGLILKISSVRLSSKGGNISSTETSLPSRIKVTPRIMGRDKTIEANQPDDQNASSPSPTNQRD